MTKTGGSPRGKFTGGGLLMAAMFVLFANAASAQEQGWALTQRSAQMGDLYTYVSPNGLKWTVPKLGANIATMGPSWAVNMYNDKTRSYFTTTFQSWQQSISRRDQRTLEMRQNPWVKAGGGSIAGLRATKFVMQNKAPVAGRRTLAAVAAAECWVADDITVPASVADMLANTYGMPKTKYFPLRISFTGSDGKQGVALDTYKCEARAIPQNYFGAPQGYKLVASQAEVFMDDETQQMMNDMASEMGLDAPKRPQQQRSVAVPVQRGTGMAIRNNAAPQSNNDLSKMLDALKGGK
jgi:hypothetical protein